MLFLKGNIMYKLLLILLLMGGVVMGQSRLGSSRVELYSEFKGLNPEFGVSEEGDGYMSVVFERSYTRYYFNDAGVCNVVAIVPLRQGDLNFFVEQYNRSYVIMGSTSWRMYSKDGSIATIELVTSNDVSMFIWGFVK